MSELERVLIIDPSKLGQEALSAVLEPRCQVVLLAESARAGKALISANPDLSMVLADVEMQDPDTREMLGAVASLPEPRPHMIIVTSRPSEQDALGASDLGVDGYLTKPVLFRDITRALKQSQGELQKAAHRVRSTPAGVAFMIEGASSDRRSETLSRMAWDIHDLSITGAFLETKMPFPVGKELDLMIVVQDRPLRVCGRVVRVQEPSWDHVAGVGVAFSSFEEGHEAALSRFIESRVSQSGSR